MKKLFLKSPIKNTNTIQFSCACSSCKLMYTLVCEIRADILLATSRFHTLFHVFTASKSRSFEWFFKARWFQNFLQEMAVFLLCGIAPVIFSSFDRYLFPGFKMYLKWWQRKFTKSQLKYNYHTHKITHDSIQILTTPPTFLKRKGCSQSAVCAVWAVWRRRNSRALILSGNCEFLICELGRALSTWQTRIKRKTLVRKYFLGDKNFFLTENNPISL